MENCNALYTLFFIIFLSQTGMAQDAKINLIWEEEEQAFFSGNLHRVKCEFTTDINHKVKLIVKPETPLKLLSPSSYKIDSKTETINSSSIKLYFPQTGGSDKDSLSCEIIVQSMEDNTVLGKAKLCFEIKERKVIRMEPTRSQIPIDANDSLVLVPIRVKNMGKRKYEVEIALQNKPQGLKMLESKMVFMLNPKQDTLINFKVQPDKSWQKVHSAFFDFILTTLKDGEKVTDCKIAAFPMGHVKKFFHPHFTINNTHEFGLGIQSRGANQKVIDFSGRGKSPFYKGTLNYQLQSFYYSGLGKVNLSSSYLNYYANKRSITLGHVSYNDETSLSGRGITYEVEKDSQYLHLSYINGSFKLFDSSLASNTQTGNSFVGGFRKIVPKLGVVETNGMIRLRESSNTGLFWFSNTIANKRNYLSFRLGLSGEQYKIQTADKAIYGGVALSADYEKLSSAWTFLSSNHFSTPRYAGNMAGNFFSRNKVEFLGNEHFIIKASASIQKAKSFESKNFQLYNRSSNYFKYQVQFETTQAGPWKFIISPSQIYDRRNFIDLSQPDKFYVSKTSRIKMALNRKRGSFSVLWKNDIGFFKFGEEGAYQKQYLFYRFDLKISTKNLNINTTFNQGSTFLSNAIKYEQFDIKNSDFLFGVRWGKWFFGRKVKANFSNRLTYNNIRKQWTNSCAFKIKSILPRSLTLDTEFVVFRTGEFIDTYWNMKLVKKIGNYRPPSGAKKLKLILFEDSNNNGTWEDSERTLPGIFVQIDGIPFVTKEGGWVQYKSVPMGEYAVNVIDPSGELAGSRQKIRMEDNSEIHLPLYKTVALAGIVKEIKVRFKSSKFDLIGIPIIAKNVQEEVFTTYTQPDGSFAFNLPENEYTVYIDAVAFGKNFEFPDNFQKVVLAQNEPADLSLSVKVKSRKMTIQKF